jgi:hypothetical protein
MNDLRALLLESIELNVRMLRLVMEPGIEMVPLVPGATVGASVAPVPRPDNIAAEATTDASNEALTVASNDAVLDQCELLWDRRRALHEPTEEPTDNVCPINPQELYSPVVEPDEPEAHINPLFRLSVPERDQLLYKFFCSARSNIEQMGTPPDSPEFNEQVQAESDRLIQDWIDFQYKNRY